MSLKWPLLAALAALVVTRFISGRIAAQRRLQNAISQHPHPPKEWNGSDLTELVAWIQEKEEKESSPFVTFWTSKEQESAAVFVPTELETFQVLLSCQPSFSEESAFGNVPNTVVRKALCKVSNNLIQKWENLLDLPIDLQEEMKILTTELLGFAAFGSDFENLKGFSSPEDSTPLSIVPSSPRNPLSEIWNLLPLNFGVNFFGQTDSKFDRVVKDLIEKRRSKKILNNSDLLNQLLLQGPKNDFLLNQDQILMDLRTFLSNGDSMANTLTWCLYEISQHPDMEKKLLSEISSNTSEGHSHLPYLSAFVQEVLRLYPGAPFSCVLQQPQKVSSFEIPEKAKIYFIPALIQWKGKYFQDPKKFNPERWLQNQPSERPNFSLITKNLTEICQVIEILLPKYHFKFVGDALDSSSKSVSMILSKRQIDGTLKVIPSVDPEPLIPDKIQRIEVIRSPEPIMQVRHSEQGNQSIPRDQLSEQVQDQDLQLLQQSVPAPTLATAISASEKEEDLIRKLQNKRVELEMKRNMEMSSVFSRLIIGGRKVKGSTWITTLVSATLIFCTFIIVRLWIRRRGRRFLGLF